MQKVRSGIVRDLEGELSQQQSRSVGRAEIPFLGEVARYGFVRRVHVDVDVEIDVEIGGRVADDWILS